jgi:hypothetical protein
MVHYGLFATASVRDQAVGVMSTLERYCRSVGTAIAAGEKLHNDAAYVMHSMLKLVEYSEGQRGDGGPQPMAPLVALAAEAGPGSSNQRQLHSLFAAR